MSCLTTGNSFVGQIFGVIGPICFNESNFVTDLIRSILFCFEFGSPYVDYLSYNITVSHETHHIQNMYEILRLSLFYHGTVPNVYVFPHSLSDVHHSIPGDEQVLSHLRCPGS